MNKNKTKHKNLGSSTNNEKQMKKKIFEHFQTNQNQSTSTTHKYTQTHTLFINHKNVYLFISSINNKNK